MRSVNSALLAGIANHLWESTLFALIVGGFTLLARKNGARIRYVLWLTASAKFLVPFSLLVAFGSLFPSPFGTGGSAPASFISTAGQMAAPFTPLGGARATGAAHAAADSGAIILLALGMLWALGAMAAAVRWFLRWRLVRRALTESTQSRIAFAIPVRMSSSQLEPGVVGILRPVLLLPGGIQDRLTSEQMRAVLAHERNHVAWRDNLAAALHMLVEVLYWFHPLVWWIGKRLIEERERACDERVLADGHSPETYAESILKICEHYLDSRLPCVAGVSGANLRQRIEGIMNNRMIERLSGVRKMALATAAVATIAIPVAIGVITSTTALAEADPSATAAVPGYKNVSIQLATAADGKLSFNIALKPDGTVKLHNISLRSLIASAYRVTESQVVGLDWGKEPRYDISYDGLTPSPMDDKAHAIMRDVLARHFGVVLKEERSQRDGYVLLIASGGSKLKPNGADPASPASFRVSPTSVEAVKLPLGTLVKPLEAFLQAPVVDETGLQGNFDYKATWEVTSPDMHPDRETVLKALEDQLGLHVEARTLDVPVINVISVKSPEQVVTKRVAAN